MPRKKSASKKAKEQQEKQLAAFQQPQQLQKQEEFKKKKSVKFQKEDNVDVLDNDTNDESDESSSSSDEDEYGELLDNETDSKINQVLSALKSNDKTLLDSSIRFFEDPEEAVRKLQANANGNTSEKNKPMYLKDYHRMNLLSGKPIIDDEEEGNYDDETGEKIKTFAETQRDERNKLLSEINDAFKTSDQEDNSDTKEDKDDSDSDNDENDDDDDEFLKKKTPKAATHEKIETKLPDPDKDQEKFLEAFLSTNAWIPRSKEDRETMKVGEEDPEAIQAEQEFDDAVENFEKVYNFRYEDANSADIISYARNQATMRRSKMNSRKKQRLKKQEKVKEEKRQHEEKVNKKKQEKINKVMDRLAEIKKAIGQDVDNEVIKKVFGDSLLNDDFDDSEWDNKMSEIFNEQFYREEEKPEWGDDDDIMKEFYDSKKKENKKTSIDNSDDDDEEEEEEESEKSKTKTQQDINNELSDENDEDENENEGQPPRKKSKKDKLKEKKAAKKAKENLKRQAEEIVQSNLVKVEDEVDADDVKSGFKKDEVKFKYREVAPESFGLTSKEILLAGDKALNEFIGLKKMAPYRPVEQINKDRRKVSKKRRLQEWRKSTFGSPDGVV